MIRPIAVPSFLLLLIVSYPMSTLAQFGETSGNRVTLTGTIYTEKGDHPILHANVRLCDGGEICSRKRSLETRAISRFVGFRDATTFCRFLLSASNQITPA